MFEKTENKRKRGRGWSIFLKKTLIVSFYPSTLSGKFVRSWVRILPCYLDKNEHRMKWFNDLILRLYLPTVRLNRVVYDRGTFIRLATEVVPNEKTFWTSTLFMCNLPSIFSSVDTTLSILSSNSILFRLFPSDIDLTEITIPRNCLTIKWT